MEETGQDERRPKGERKDGDKEASAPWLLPDESKRFRFDDWASI